MSSYDPAIEQATIAWLHLVDAGDAGASWRAAATLFRSAVTEAQWKQSVNALRTALGGAVERHLDNARSATQLPGAPDGHYVVFQFNTRFEHKQSAVETVTPMQDADGVWRVSGYFVR